MELLSLLVAAKMSGMPMADGIYRFEWKRAWVDVQPAPQVLVIDTPDDERLG